MLQTFRFSGVADVSADDNYLIPDSRDGGNGFQVLVIYDIKLLSTRTHAV